MGQAVYDFPNQYPPALGIPELRKAVAAHSERFSGLPVDWQTEAIVTVGATEALASAFMGLLNEGDEVCVTAEGAHTRAEVTKKHQPFSMSCRLVHLAEAI